MRKYLWIAVIALIACTVYFTSCDKGQKMMDTIMPDAEQVETPETPEPAPEMTAAVEPTVAEPTEPTVAEPMPPPTPVAILAVEPPGGSRISPDTTIAVTFDGAPADLTVSIGELSVSDANATITGPFMGGSLTLNLIWADGIETLSYVVEEAVPPPPEGMVAIPAGDFEMGDNDSGVAQPVHAVWVDAFYMDTHEVTNLDYKRFVLANPEWEKRKHGGNYLAHWDGNNNYPEGKANHPVQYVNWHAARAYAEWIGKRLPTEAEWEKAARGGLVGKPYVTGDFRRGTDSNHGKDTTPVGSYAPNGYGLYDMSGNVSEFCLDHYDPDFYSMSPSRNPLNGALPSNTIADLDALVVTESTQIVLRGSSWVHGDHGVAHRYFIGPSGAHPGTSFRCVQDVNP